MWADQVKNRLTYANVMATIAVFTALGGSSYAALTVTGSNVKNGSLTGKDVKNNSLTGTDVKRLTSGDVQNASLLAEDFKPGQLPSGSQGDAGPSDVYYVTKENVAHLFRPVSDVPTTVTSLSLPPGQYLVEANLVVVNLQDFPYIVRCHIRVAGTDFPATAAQVGAFSGEHTSPIDQMSASAPVSLSAPGAAVLLCTLDGAVLYSVRPYVESVRMYAIKTGNLVSKTDTTADPYP